MRRLLPIVVFASALALMQWTGGLRLTPMPLITLGVFVMTIVVARRVRWQGRIFRARPGSRRWTALLFALFVRHFAGILAAETRRARPHRSGAPEPGRPVVHAHGVGGRSAGSA